MLKHRAVTGLAFLLAVTFGLNTRVFAQTTITTVAGTGIQGFSGDGGLATAAQLANPRSVSVDAAGNIFIADLFNHRIRKVDPAGTITTVAGTGTAGFSGDGGPATAAQLNGPRGLFVDAAGNIFIADQSNQRIRKVDTGGTITTVAGTGTAGFFGDGGPATAAQLSYPVFVFVDAASNIFIADTNNDRIRKVDTGGTITTVAGTSYGFSGDGGPATSAQLKRPASVFVDATGNIFIADQLNNRIRKVNTGGIITTVVGGGVVLGDGGPATAAQLLNPAGVFIDAVGNIFIADHSNHRIRKVDTGGTITTVAGMGTAGFNGDGGPATAAQLNNPVGVFVDAAGDLFIGDQTNHRVRKVAPLPFLVTNTDDSGTGSLRQAILNANADAGTQTITFDIPGAGPHTIQPLSSLPNLTDPVVIDGTSEPDFAGAPIIELDGSNAGATASGLHITAGSSTVKGLVINRFNFSAIGFSGAGGNVLEGNYIGTDVSGTVALGNGGTGGMGIGFATSNNTIGGTTPAARNIISGNTFGLLISGGANNLVQGNYIGTDVSGTVALPNLGEGVRVQNAAGGLIGGTAAGAGNLISGNGSNGASGILIFSNSANYQVQGNYIGTDVTGTAALGNVASGIQVWSASNITIGGTVAGAGNLISGNGSYGVSIDGPGVTVEGNIIGADAGGTLPLGNASSGVVVGSNTIIGGQATNAGNLIAFNNQHGIYVGGTANALWSNNIHANGNLGIGFGGATPTPNDLGDGDTGNNNLQNHPVLSTAFISNSTISGSLNSTASTTFRLEFFANSACDASGFGEGETFLSATDVTTDGSGNVSFSVPLPGSVALGEFITATATDPGNNTSEFSPCIEVIEGSVAVSMPDATTLYGTTLQIPVLVSETSGQGVVAAEVFICYDGDLVTPVGTDLTGTLAASGWSIQSNIEDGGQIDTYKIAMATDDDVLVGAGTLVNIQFQVIDVRVPSSSVLQLKHVLFNDGTPGNTAVDGSLTVIGNTGTINSLPAQIVPRETITITVLDADLDTDGNPGTNSVNVSVTNTNNGDTVNLTLDEDAVTAGTFSTTVDTEFGTAAVVDALLQAQANDAIVATYADALDASGNGPTDRTAQTNVIGGADGSVEITLVSQPGDPLYIQVTDADLNTNDTSAETASVTVENSRTLESFTVVLTEVDLDDDVFFGSLPTTSGASTSSDMSTAEDDIVTATYDDVVTLVGDQQDRIDINDVIFPWGDADDNDVLQAFDAAKILVHVLNGTPIDEEAANVDDETVTSGINPFDASLVLQKRVGLIATFPVQDPTAENHPQGDPASPKRMPKTRHLSLVLGEGYLSVHAIERGDLLSGDLTIEGITGRIEMSAEMANYLSASKTTAAGIRIVFAGAEAVFGPGELLRIYGTAPSSIELTAAVFNNGGITGTASGLISMVTPQTFALHPNVPNPFNPETTIRFELPQAAEATLEVFDVLGQKVKTLVRGALQAGTHSAVWHGRNELGAQVGNGVYLYRLQAGEFTQMRRMLLLK